MTKAKSRFTCDIQLESESALETVNNYLNQTSTLKRSQIERALVSFYYPEAIFESQEPLTKQQQWQLFSSIYELECRLKLYRQFFQSSLTDTSLDLALAKGEETIKAVSAVTTANFSTSSESLDIDDDDDFAEGGI